jgi:hypothetical protein
VLTAFTLGLLNQRAWMRANFPAARSLLAIDILVHAAHSTLRKHPTSMKDLLNAIPFSEVGIRKQVTRLVKEGWLRIDRSSADKRIRILVAEDKLLAVLQRYSAQCALINSAA